MDKVKVGFIGGGGIASIHLKNLAKDDRVEIISICDIVKENAEKTASKYNAKAYTNAEEMLEKESVDALFLCVPPFAHGDIEEKAAQKGIHLMVEKPLGLDVDTARYKLKVIQESGIICASGYCLRYLDTVKKAKEYLKDKQIAMIRGHYITSFVPTPWYREMNKSGGQLVEQATHTMDLIRYLGGEINQVYANMNLQVLKDIENIDIPDATSVNFTLNSGAVGHLDCSFTQTDHRMGVELLGKDFRVVIDGVNLTIVEKDSTITYPSKVDFYEEQDKAFIEAVLTGNRAVILSNYESGLNALEVTLAANKSQELGKPIPLT